MTCIVSPATYPSKKALAAAVAERPGHVWITDPSIFPGSRGDFIADALKPGEVVFVTNHPKRSWFAQVGRTSAGRLYVK